MSPSSGAQVTLPHGERYYTAPRSFGRALARVSWEMVFGFNTLLLALGCGLFLGILVLNTLVITKLVAAKQVATNHAQEAFAHFQVARTALSTMDLGRSAEEFGEAERALQTTKQDIDTALEHTYGLGYLFYGSSTFRSALHLLQTGIHIAHVGKEMSESLKPLTSVVLFADDAQKTPVTLVSVLSNARAQLNEVTGDIDDALYHLDQVNSSILPRSVQAQWNDLHRNVKAAHTSLISFLNNSDVLLSLLGADGERHYLIVFQNNHEIRPTGGFIGSIALVRVDAGVVEAVDVQSVYDPDGQLGEYIEPPAPLSKITPRFYMRDANWFVDYKTSAQKIAAFLEKEKGPTVDGIIALTPEVIRSLLTIAGPIEMPQYGVTVTDQNFVTLTQEQVTYNYNREVNRPKQFLADLTPVLLNKLFQQPTKAAGPLLSTLTTMLNQKHILLYFPNETLQTTVEAMHWAGRMPADDNLVYVNNANIAGHKSDQFMTQHISYAGTITEQGALDVTVTIQRTHHGPEEGIALQYPKDENPVWKDNIVFQRVFVPPNATLQEATGFTPDAAIPALVEREQGVVLTKDSDVDLWQQSQRIHPSGTIIGQEAGHAYFANWVVTKPGMTSTVSYRYTVPTCHCLPTLVSPYKSFDVHWYKQPGDMRTTYTTAITVPQTMRVDRVATLGQFTATSPYAFLSEGSLTTDAFIGIMYEKK